MRLLFFTDTHIRGTNPQNRKDNFFETVYRKIEEVFYIAKRHSVDILLHGGDIFDRPDISPSLVREFMILISKYDFPIYAVAGNHDIYGQNPHTLNRTMLGLLDGADMIKLLHPGEKTFLQKGSEKIQLTGQHYFYGIDADYSKNGYIIEKDSDSDFAIHMVHGMLLEKPFFEKMAYTLIEEIVKTQADITLCGHYHTGFGIKQIDGKYFVNPGSLVRINNSIKELSRMPKVVIIDTKAGPHFEEITLSTALPGEKVLDRSKVEALAFKEKKISEFIQSIYSTGVYNTIDINSILEEISNQQDLKEDVVKEALKRISTAQELLGSSDNPEVS